MPEIGEVARVVSHLRKHLVGKTISKVDAPEDLKLFKNTTAKEFTTLMTGKQVVDVKQWGKYFWLVMSSPPHALLHFGMTGWLHIKNDPKASYQSMKSGADESTQWPPKFSKFVLEIEGSNNQFAFADVRRFGRVQLINEKDGNNIRNVAPLSANGPDPVQEKLDKDWLFTRLRKKAVPVKGFLLDQAIIAGIGNWVADEILYHARIYPETVTNNLSEGQMQALFDSINYVTKTAVEAEAEQSLFPKNWLMLHRWGKGKNNEGGAGKLPTGEKIEFITVSGRTSAYVPSLQKRGANDPAPDAEVIKPAKGKKGKKEASSLDEEEEKPKAVKGKRGKKVEELSEEEVEGEEPKATGSRKTTTVKKVVVSKVKKEAATTEEVAKKPAGRTSKKTVAKEETGPEEQSPGTGTEHTITEEKPVVKRGRKAKPTAQAEETAVDEEAPVPKRRKAAAAPARVSPPPTLRRGRSALKSNPAAAS
ncbi:Formamidopyrimidine-DNA glycosylase N-terminal domain-containing protein [Peziza echinospora]|nr:Formamidopyrimidine-DNA glycosylase N-terminal domain-containing protein [Peziza echinospora]